MGLNIRIRSILKKVWIKLVIYPVAKKYFSKDFYLNNYQDVKDSQINPFYHYMEYGWREERNPSEVFDTRYYLETNKDVRDAKVNPLIHYLKHGKKEGRRILPKSIFQTENDNCHQEVAAIDYHFETWEFLYGDFELNKDYSNFNIEIADKESGWIRGEIVKSIHLIKDPLKTALLPGEHNELKGIYANLLNIPEDEIKTTGLDNNVDYHWNFEDDPPDFGHFNIIISQAMLEHLIDPYKHVKDLFEALEPGGHLILHTVIPGFQYHRYPIDCFRFFPDWFEEIAIRLDAKIADKYIGEQRILYRYCKVSP